MRGWKTTVISQDRVKRMDSRGGGDEHNEEGMEEKHNKLTIELNKQQTLNKSAVALKSFSFKFQSFLFNSFEWWIKVSQSAQYKAIEGTHGPLHILASSENGPQGLLKKHFASHIPGGHLSVDRCHTVL